MTLIPSHYSHHMCETCGACNCDCEDCHMMPSGWCICETCPCGIQDDTDGAKSPCNDYHKRCQGGDTACETP